MFDDGARSSTVAARGDFGYAALTRLRGKPQLPSKLAAATLLILTAAGWALVEVGQSSTALLKRTLRLQLFVCAKKEDLFLSLFLRFVQSIRCRLVTHLIVYEQQDEGGTAD